MSIGDYKSILMKLLKLAQDGKEHSLRGSADVIADEFQLTPEEKKDLVAFIKTLRDESFLTNPAFAAPAKLPDGSAVQY